MRQKQHSACSTNLLLALNSLLWLPMRQTHLLYVRFLILHLGFYYNGLGNPGPQVPEGLMVMVILYAQLLTIPHIPTAGHRSTTGFSVNVMEQQDKITTVKPPLEIVTFMSGNVGVKSRLLTLLLVLFNRRTLASDHYVRSGCQDTPGQAKGKLRILYLRVKIANMFTVLVYFVTKPDVSSRIHEGGCW
ncbi:hypothetical protein EDD18DRAFT_1112486 [Armillaria luteobubalina]|uniref:Uncharacterized protein n=1 Tax=Armillaria luteobubalina TaxID=153913 RepID=A0AA39PES4_9AGAR|nr:hypothetical protein EDD18DRAFT_1112486 [Armillaria luteobubalina]